MKKILMFFCVSLTALCYLGCKDNAGRDVVEVTVASELRDCSGVGRMQCMLVKFPGYQSWEYFYSPIEGFEYEPGYEYVLKVRKQKVENPPADASSVKYTLVKTVSKTRKESAGLPERMPME